jgi:hypothetical protein
MTTGAVLPYEESNVFDGEIVFWIDCVDKTEARRGCDGADVDRESIAVIRRSNGPCLWENRYMSMVAAAAPTRHIATTTERRNRNSAVDSGG